MTSRQRTVNSSRRNSSISFIRIKFSLDIIMVSRQMAVNNSNRLNSCNSLSLGRCKTLDSSKTSCQGIDNSSSRPNN